MYRDVILNYEPRKKIMSKFRFPQSEPEMSEFESAFLCGMLCEHKPKKILEVGVAGGGTTSIIMQCLSDISNDYELYSVDLNEKFYREKSEKSGYLAEEAKKYISNVRHRIFLGKIAPEVIDEIGGNIDCLILDTVHVTPGEILDFLALFPYLSENAIVILHDICLNYCTKDRARYHDLRNCTKLLFDCVTADKYFMRDDSATERNGFPNIAAFQLNDQTKKDIAYVVGVLSNTWGYEPDKAQFMLYRNAIIKNLNEKERWLFDAACKLNFDIFNSSYSLYRRLKSCARVLIRGC